jgi:hypothetical protein
MNPESLAELAKGAFVGFPLGCVLVATPAKALYIAAGALLAMGLNRLIESR